MHGRAQAKLTVRTILLLAAAVFPVTSKGPQGWSFPGPGPLWSSAWPRVRIAGDRAPPKTVKGRTRPAVMAMPTRSTSTSPPKSRWLSRITALRQQTDLTGRAPAQGSRHLRSSAYARRVAPAAPRPRRRPPGVCHWPPPSTRQSFTYVEKAAGISLSMRPIPGTAVRRQLHSPPLVGAAVSAMCRPGLRPRLPVPRRPGRNVGQVGRSARPR